MSPGELRAFLRHADEAMMTEGLTEHVRERVLNRLIWGHPRGYRPAVDLAACQPPLGTGWAYGPDGVQHTPEPKPGSVIYGGDTREILPGEQSPLHPLHSDCWCGVAIMKERGDVPWQHCG